MPVPGKGHEGIGNDKKQNGFESAHYLSWRLMINPTIFRQSQANLPINLYMKERVAYAR
jgi:hypothetical protein